MEDVEDDESNKQSVLLPLVMRSQGELFWLLHEWLGDLGEQWLKTSRIAIFRILVWTAGYQGFEKNGQIFFHTQVD